MTIPITPGPFSFLSSAGEAVGEIGKALEIKRQRLDAEAHSRLNDILSLIQAGAEPGPFLAAGGAAAERLKLAAPGQGAALLSGPAERARLALDLARSQTRKEGVAASVAEQTQGAQVQTAQEAARIAKINADAATSDLGVRQRINQLVTEELKVPESNFGLLAARAAAGTLPYYAAIIQSRAQDRTLERQANADRFKLFFEPLDNAGPLWQQRVQQWESRKTLETSGMEPDEVKEWEKNNPAPALVAVQQELLENAARARGMTVDQYNAELNKTVGLHREAEAQHFTSDKIQSLQMRVNDVLAGKKTRDQAHDDINTFYAARGGPQSKLDAQLDILQFDSMLQGAQRESTRTKR